MALYCSEAGQVTPYRYDEVETAHFVRMFVFLLNKQTHEHSICHLPEQGEHNAGCGAWGPGLQQALTSSLPVRWDKGLAAVGGHGRGSSSVCDIPVSEKDWGKGSSCHCHPESGEGPSLLGAVGLIPIKPQAMLLRVLKTRAGKSAQCT